MRFLASAGTFLGLTALLAVFALAFREFLGLGVNHRVIRKLARPWARLAAIVLGLSPVLLVFWDRSWLVDTAPLEVVPEWVVRVFAMLFALAAPAVAGASLSVPPAARHPIPRLRVLCFSGVLFWINFVVLWWRSQLFNAS